MIPKTADHYIIKGQYNDYLIPDWQTIAEGYIKDYGLHLQKKAYYNKDKLELICYGWFYAFCLDCGDLENCKVGKLLKSSPLHLYRLWLYNAYLRGNIQKVAYKINIDIADLSKSMENIDYAQKEATKIFKGCEYRQIALELIKEKSP